MKLTTPTLLLAAALMFTVTPAVAEFGGPPAGAGQLDLRIERLADRVELTWNQWQEDELAYIIWCSDDLQTWQLAQRCSGDDRVSASDYFVVNDIIGTLTVQCPLSNFDDLGYGPDPEVAGTFFRVEVVDPDNPVPGSVTLRNLLWVPLAVPAGHLVVVQCTASEGVADSDPPRPYVSLLMPEDIDGEPSMPTEAWEFSPVVVVQGKAKLHDEEGYWDLASETALIQQVIRPVPQWWKTGDPAPVLEYKPINCSDVVGPGSWLEGDNPYLEMSITAGSPRAEYIQGTFVAYVGFNNQYAAALLEDAVIDQATHQ